MRPSELRAKAQEQIKRAVQESQKNKDYTAGGYESYWVAPEGVSSWSPKGNDKGVTHYIDIIPFLVGDNFPDKVFDKGRPPDAGQFWHVMDLHIHKSIGSENEWVVCPKNSFKSLKGRDTRCPICEDMTERQRDEPDDEKRKAIWRELKPFRRCMYNVVVYDGGEEEDKGVQIFEVAHFYLQLELDKLSSEDERSGEGPTSYPDPDIGSTIKFTVTKSGSGKDSKVTYDGHQFVKRVDGKKKPYKISDDILDQAITLDDLLKVLTYDELFDKYHGKVEKEKEETKPEKEEQPTRGRRGKPEPEKEPEKPKEEERPTPRKGREPVKEEKEEDAPFDADKCPDGHEFGADCRQKPSCNDCPDAVYDLCDAKKEELDKAAKGDRRSRR